MSNKAKLKQPEFHVLCPECGLTFASLADRKAHYKLLGGEQMCLHPQHGYLNMYKSRGAWRRPRT